MPAAALTRNKNKRNLRLGNKNAMQFQYTRKCNKGVGQAQSFEVHHVLSFARLVTSIINKFDWK